MQSLGQIKKKNTGGNFGLFAVLAVLAVILLVGIEVYRNRASIPFGSSKQQADNTIPESEFSQYEAFNKAACVAMNNIGYHNVDGRGNDLVQFFDKGILYDVENSWLAPDICQEIKTNQLYMFSNDVQDVASKEEKIYDSQAKVQRDVVSSWFTGMVTYQSRIKPGYLRIPFSLKLYTQKIDNQFKVVKFENLTKNPQ